MLRGAGSRNVILNKSGDSLEGSSGNAELMVSRNGGPVNRIALAS
jgi:hypothetical protein